jgi:hypothetical protein
MHLPMHEYKSVTEEAGVFARADHPRQQLRYSCLGVKEKLDLSVNFSFF